MSRLFTVYFMMATAIAVCCPFSSQAQTAHLEPEQPAGPLFRPRLSMGFGQLHYFGDVGNLGGISKPSYLNWGSHIMLQNPINDAFDLNVFALFGRITASERLAADEYNFQSSVRMGGLSLSYNFDHILPKDRGITPYVSVGISTFEFNPKTDRHDAYGRAYHHWADGTVRSLAESHPNAANAIPLSRNYVYETDLRSLEQPQNMYALRAITIPIGVGAEMKISDKFKLRMGAEYHFSNTDHLDGLAGGNDGVAGLAGNDRFLYSSIALSYNLHHTKAMHPGTSVLPAGLDLLDQDEDGDGVSDFYDICPFTPPGVSVDQFGCPLDADGDGVPDHLDREPNSLKGAVVNEFGVALTDADHEHMYRVYLGEVFDQNFEKSSTSTADVAQGLKMGSRSKGYRLTVTGLDNISSDQLAQLLSIPDVKTKTEDGRTSYFVGDYNTTTGFLEAALRFRNAGLDYMVEYNDFGKLTPIDESQIFDGEDFAPYAAMFANTEVTFRVQIGAFSKAVSPQLFKDIPDVLVIPGTDGLTRYVSGAFQSIQDAANHKVNLLLKGYEGAFVTAYRGGKRITLKEAGATVTREEDLSAKGDKTEAINKDFVKYTVQLGIFNGRIPAEILGEYMTLGNVRPVRSDDGTTKYIYSSFTTLAEAQKTRTLLLDKGLKEALVVGEFNGQIIPVDEARKLRNE